MCAKRIKISSGIPCGGASGLLWPPSRVDFLKHLILLYGSSSLFHRIVERNNGNAAAVPLGKTLAVTGVVHRFLVLDRPEGRDSLSATLFESVGRNDAPVLTPEAFQAMANDAKPIPVITPADHAVTDDSAFSEAPQKSTRVFVFDAIVVLGITANHPKTAYCRTKREEIVGQRGRDGMAQFCEKQNLETAQPYLASEYIWNSGMFLLGADNWLNTLFEFRHAITAARLQAWANRSADEPFVRFEKAEFTIITRESIGDTVIEQYLNSEYCLLKIAVPAAGRIDCDKVSGFWKTLGTHSHGNVTRGKALIANKLNAINQTTSTLVGAIGVRGLVIIEIGDAVFAIERGISQNAKDLVPALELKKHEEYAVRPKVRPWGHYEDNDEADCLKVERIPVKSHANLGRHSPTAVRGAGLV